jgi:hypothetical protein
VISEDLTLNIGPALSEVANLERTLLSMIAEVASKLAGEINAALAQTDAAPVGAAIETAVERADKTVTAEPDAEAIAPAVEGAIEGADKTVEAAPDVEQVAPAIEGAIEGADKVAVVEGDAEGVAVAVEHAVDSADTSIELAEPDTTAFEEAISQAVSSATADLAGLDGQTKETAGGVANLTGEVKTLENASEVLSATTGALGGNVGAIVGKLGPYGAALGAVAGATGLLVSSSIKGQAATERFNTILGEQAKVVERIDIGGLDTSLGELTLSLGSSGAATRQVAASLFQLQVSSGATNEAAAETTKQMIALAANAVATNPAIGSVDEAVQGLSAGLARGGRSLVQYGISLNQHDITERAVKDTGKLAEELTVADKSAAGARIAMERLGGSIGTTVAAGSEKAEIQIRRLHAEISSAISAAGKPLVAPVLEVFRALGPDVVQIVRLLGTTLQLLTPALSAITDILHVLEPELKLTADLLEAVSKDSNKLSLDSSGLTDKLIPQGGAWRMLAASISLMRGQSSEAAVGQTGLTRVLDSTTESLGAQVSKIDDLAGSISGAAIASTAYDKSTGQVGETVDALTPKLADLQLAMEAYAKVVADTFPSVAGAFDELAKKSDELAKAVLSGAPSISEAFKKATEDSKTSLAELTKALDDQIKAETKYYDNVRKIAASGAQALAEELIAEGPARGAAAAQAIASGTPAQVAALESRAQALKAVESKASADLAAISVGGMQKALTDQQAAETQFFQNLNYVIAAGGVTIADTILKMGPVRGAAFAQALAKAQPTLIKSLETSAQGLIDKEAFIAQALGKSLGEGWATAAAEGFAAGLLRSVPIMDAATIQATTKVAKTGNQILDIHSPSKVFERMGEEVSAGLALGIRSSIPNVAAAMGALSNVIVPVTASSVAGGTRSTSVTVAPGAVQVVFPGGAAASMPDVEATLDRAFGRLLQEIGRR